MWCIAEITSEYRKRMYKLLTLYGRGCNRDYPVICMDEKSKQLIEDARKSIGLKPGSPIRYDGEYRRKGTRNIFVAVEPLAGKRIIKVTPQRKKRDFAYFIKELVERHYRTAKKYGWYWIISISILLLHFMKHFQKRRQSRSYKRLSFTILLNTEVG